MKNSIEEDIKIVGNILYKGYTMSILHPNTNIKECEIKAIEHILSDYKRVLNELNKQQTTINKYAKENEELKETYKSEKKMKNEYVKLYQDLLLKENVIPIQKVKDKLEKIDEELEIMKVDNMYGRYKEYGGKTKWERLFATKYGTLDALQELLEGRK